MGQTKQLSPTTQEEIKKLLTLAFDEGDVDNQPLNEWLDLDAIKDSFEADETQIVMRFAGNDLIALAIFGKENPATWPDGKKAELLAIAIHPDHQGKGVGGEFLAGIKKIAKSKYGANSIITKVHTDVTAAQKFFEKYGYIEIGELKDYFANGNAKVYKLDIK